MRGRDVTWALAAGAALVLAPACGSSEPAPAAGTPAPAAAGPSPFQAVYRVFSHPRCVNCHPAGEAPLQGEDGHPHAQNVKRGPDGRGKFALKCANCHVPPGLPGVDLPPPHPGWRLPGPDMPLVFEGRSPRELARQLKDPRQNGGRTLEQVQEHVEHDSLVAGCWTPGGTRQPPPVSHADFVAGFRAWVAQGAPDPE